MSDKEWVKPNPDWMNAEATGASYETGRVSDLRLKAFPALERVVRVLPPGTIIAGGAFADMLRGETPHDIDIFFSDLSLTTAVQDRLRQFEDYEPVAFSPTSSLFQSKSTKVTLNLLHSVAYADASALIDRFDLNVCQVAMTPDGRVAYSGAGVEQALASRMALHRAQASLPTRLNKYRVKGFEISDELIEAALRFGASPYKYDQYRLRREHAKIYGMPVVTEAAEPVVAPAPEPEISSSVEPELVPAPVEASVDDVETARRKLLGSIDPELQKLLGV